MHFEHFLNKWGKKKWHELSEEIKVTAKETLKSYVSIRVKKLKTVLI